jgi:hypothetical protein
MYLYGIDTNSADLYDIVLHLDCLNVDSAVEILHNVSRSPCFRTTEESDRKLNDMLIEAKVYSIIVERYPDAKVKCKNGTVLISVESSLSAEKKIAKNFAKLIREIDGVKDVKTYVIPFET